jgi:hypothetical protein
VIRSVVLGSVQLMYSEERKAVKRNEESLLKVKSVLDSNMTQQNSKSSALLLFT